MKLTDKVPQNYLKEFLKNPVYFFTSESDPDMIKLMLLNTLKETAASGVGGAKMLERIQQQDWYKKFSEWANSFTESDLENYFIDQLNERDSQFKDLINCY